MRMAALAVVMVALAGIDGAGRQQGTADVFPFRTATATLENGLEVIAIPFDSPGIVAFYTVVRVGSRDEVQPGRTGFAHFFEHMMFRGTEKYSQEEYNDILKRMGADSNAYTTDDYTAYHITGPASKLALIMELEADRFTNLKYTEEVFRTEALAVLGEYNKTASNPFLPLTEKLRDLAFESHTYEHTTLGLLADIEAMPGYFDFSLEFFRRFYRPENVLLLAVGDVEPDKVFALARRYYADWKRGYEPAPIPVEPLPAGPASAHVPWPNPIRPHLLIGYRAPAFSVENRDWPALDVIGELLFSASAPLYQELVVERQWVDGLSGGAEDHRDPYLFEISARVRSADLLPKVKSAIQARIEALQSDPVAPARLDRVKSHLRFRFALSLDSPTAVADRVAHYLSLTGEVQTINALFARYRQVTPEDVQRVARRVFTPENRSVVTLAHGPLPGQEAAR